MCSSPPEHDVSPRALLILAGQLGLTEYVRLIKTEAVAGYRLDDHELVQEWQAARRYLQEPSQALDPASLRPDLAPIPQELSARAKAAMDDPIVTRCFGLVPCDWKVVSLEHAIVWQRHVVTCDRDTDHALRSSWSELFAIATAGSAPSPPVHLRSKDGNHFAFASASSDLRVLATTPLSLRAVEDCQIYGLAAAVVGVVIGYSLNFMVAAHVADRLILLNGTHRAYRLLRQGIKKMPCLVVRLRTFDEMGLVGFAAAAGEVEELAGRARPPLLADFLNTRLAKRIEIPHLTHLLELELQFRESTFPGV